MKKRIISLLISIVLGFVYYYFALPALNIHCISFWIFVFFVGAVYAGSNFLMSYDFVTGNIYKLVGDVKVICYAFVGMFILIMGYNLILSPMFNSNKYKNRIEVVDGVFSEDVSIVDFNSLALVDKDSSMKLGDRVMGAMPELVSQFYVSNLYTQINYNGGVYRVTPLEYDGFIKYLSNRKEGIKGYITVNSVNGEANLVKLDKGMKYVPSAILGEDLYRKLRFTYPTFIFGKESFEIDEEGNPYFVVPVIKYSGVGLLKDVKGVVVLDPVSGSSDYYLKDQIPAWIDNVYKSDIVISQINDYGKYRGGFWNSIFGQKNVVKTTEGYNYMAMNDDIYLYTGITSTLSDESNIGFVLTNMRTKATKFYTIAGAEEYSAMASSEGQVQQMGYTSTFPLLINLNNRPTYLMSLKDNAGLVKMYSFVDVVDYQKVVVSDASLGIESASHNYLDKMGFDDFSDTYIEKKIKVKSIKSYNIDGNSYFYITDSDNNKYSVSIKVNKNILPFIEVDDTVKIKYIDDVEIKEIVEIK